MHMYSLFNLLNELFGNFYFVLVFLLSVYDNCILLCYNCMNEIKFIKSDPSYLILILMILKWSSNNHKNVHV